MKNISGSLTMALGGLHLAAGVFTYADALLEIGRNGVIGTIVNFGDMPTAFWFMMWGVVFVWMGYIVRAYQKQVGSVPPNYGWMMIVLGLIGGLMMPASGFLLAVPIGLVAIFGRSNQLQLQPQ